MIDPPTAQPLYRRYVELLKRALLNELQPENGMRVSYLLECFDTSRPYELDRVLRPDRHDPDTLRRLLDDPDGADNYRERMFGFPFSMVGRARMDNVQACVEQALAQGVPGDLLEAGVWRGGTVIFMKALLDAWGDQSRRVWVADSFQGVPAPSMEQDHGVELFRDPGLAIAADDVRKHFQRFGLLDERVRFLEGWFKDTLPHAEVDRIAVLRADGDLYESTMDILDSLYDKVSPGGFVIIDDYNALACCRRAVEDFRAARGITEPIHEVDWTGAWWRKATASSADTSSATPPDPSNGLANDDSRDAAPRGTP